MNNATRHLVLEDTPVGTLLIVSDGDAVTGLFMQAGKHYPQLDRIGQSQVGDALLQRAASQLQEYFAQERTEFDLPVVAQGTPFQQAVWSALREIPYGQTRTYGELATAIGAPAASRAVGLANGRNPISIIVPCHRVIGANGNLTGYGGGLSNKEALLRLEGVESGATLF